MASFPARKRGGMNGAMYQMSGFGATIGRWRERVPASDANAPRPVQFQGGPLLLPRCIAGPREYCRFAASLNLLNRVDQTRMNAPLPWLGGPLVFASTEDAALLSPGTQWLVGLGLACVGGVFGSFMNVIVYRLPAGKSIVHPGSHCPKCARPIRWHDNIPVVSWLVLRGRCRDCDERISARYPLVEATVAAMFLILAIAHVFSDGGRLPRRDAELGGPAVSLDDVMMFAVNFYHLLLLCTLLCAALIQYDGRRLPRGLFIPALIVGLLAPLVWYDMRPVPLSTAAPAWLPSGGRAAGLLEGLAGLVIGGLLAALAWRAAGLGRRSSTTLLTAACPTALCGLFLGWQAAAGLAMISAVAYLLATALATWLPGPGATAGSSSGAAGTAERINRATRQTRCSEALAKWSSTLQRVPASAYLLLATFGWLLAWRPLVDRLPAIGDQADAKTLAIGMAAVLAGSLLVRLVSRRSIA